jgi:type II secretory pathway pseudopilin PulG
MGIVKNNNNKSLSFTLIEMLVVIGVISLTLPAFFGIFFSLLRQQGKIYALSQVKREGDFASSTITNIIRNYGISIHSSIPPDENNKINCPQSETQIINNYFLDKYGNYFRFYLESDYIASTSPIIDPSTTRLTTDKVQITNFNLACTQTSPFSPPIIKLIFTVTYKTASNRPEDTASLTYQTQIKMKSY